jgi:hypothetical protein
MNIHGIIIPKSRTTQMTKTTILSISTSQVARIAGVSFLHLADEGIWMISPYSEC